ncbi:hypothetical protein MBLNU230_g7543t1 [Neophaeotheca triangularis]
MEQQNGIDAVSEEAQFDPFEDPEEERVLHAALDSFRQYRSAAHYNVTHLRRQSFYSLPSKHMEMLSASPFSLPKTFRAVDDAIDRNADIADAILQSGLSSFGIDPSDESWRGKATPSDMDKARSTIRQLHRDWSGEGEFERQSTFSPLFEALETHLETLPSSQKHKHKVLLPGAGLGRLLFDLCCAGYTVEGNEISYHQLIASNYILNETNSAGEHQLYPWALSFSNHLTRANQLKVEMIPDVHPATTLNARSEEIQSELHYSERMSMTSGDFCSLYREPGYEGVFSAVMTCFFIDTAPNVINYIETVLHCLASGGIWINLGPLLWHFESAPTPAEKARQKDKHFHGSGSHGMHSHSHDDGAAAREGGDGIGDPGSFELSNDEVIALVERCGFEMLEQREDVAGTGYIQDPNSMLQNTYRPTFWVARRK